MFAIVLAASARFLRIARITSIGSRRKATARVARAARRLPSAISRPASRRSRVARARDRSLSSSWKRRGVRSDEVGGGGQILRGFVSHLFVFVVEVRDDRDFGKGPPLDSAGRHGR